MLSHSLLRHNPISTLQNPKSTIKSGPKSELRIERGLEFEIGKLFFRHESATGRDLDVFAASLYRKSKGKLQVFDALRGCGIRSLRYLVEAQADFVLANDGNDEERRVICENLSQVLRGCGDQRRWMVTHFEANRDMAECYLQRDLFNLIDVDSFGSDSSFLRSAMNALRLDGLLYVTSTDGFSSGGHRPYQHYGFISYCAHCGNSKAFSCDELVQISCPCSDSKSIVVSGPLWTGPLHEASYLTELLNLAKEWGRAGTGTGTKTALEKLLKQMLEESDLRLPFGFIKLDEVASRAKVNSPSS